MNKMFKVLLGATALSVAVANAGTPKFPFPQNMKHPHGHTVTSADPTVIKAHFDKWKKAWYQDKGNEAWVLAPEGICSTVSEAIAYGMMIMVYISSTGDDHQSEFDKLYATWKNNGGNGGGMNWRIGCDGGSGSATDADVDAALALVMASKQWGNDSYLSDAKKIISWMSTNDIDGNNSVKPGSQWNDAFNPSYGTLANFELFEKVSGDSKWATVKSKAAQDMIACQNSKSGLVPDWCDWSGHQPTKTSASVAQNEDPGFYDDAARTPWRAAWAYYWYGNSDAKKFNDKIWPWLKEESKGTASGINSGYKMDGTANKSATRNFVSSTFSGGLGLAAASADDGASFTKSVYRALSNMTSCAVAEGCGEDVPGEKYYPATLNLLYLLLVTGNMPNLYDMTGFTAFTPAPDESSTESGTQYQLGDTTVAVSGFWNWGAYHDKLGIGTKMTPDSGTSALFNNGGEIVAFAHMEIGPEPEWTQAAADAGTLKYPSAGIAMSFNKEESGVDLTALGAKKLVVTAKIEGPIRVAMLNDTPFSKSTPGAEPGAYFTKDDGKANGEGGFSESASAGDGYTKYTFDLTPKNNGTTNLKILSWVDKNDAPEGSEILKAAKGLKFELKDAKGGEGEITIKSIEFLDGSGNVIDPEKITGMKIVPNAITKFVAANAVRITASNKQLQISGAKIGATYSVFDMQGKKIASGKVLSANQSIAVANKGMYMVKVGNQMTKIAVK